MELETPRNAARIRALAVVLAIGATACGGGGPSPAATTEPETIASSPTTEAPTTEAPTTEAPTTEAPTPRDYSAADLEAIVHPADQPPDGTEHIETSEGEEAALTPIEEFGSPEDKATVTEGLQESRANLFVADKLAHVVASWVALYEDAEVASEVMEVVVGTVSGYLELEPEDAPLGEDAVLLQGTAPAKGNAPERSITGYVWRSGNLLLMASAMSFGGDVKPYDEARVEAIAQGMADRAV